jgi:penicillin-binding protein 2
MLSKEKQWSSLAFILMTLLLFITLGGRLFYLQIVKGDYYRGLSSQNHIRVVTKPAPRGLISDRNGVVLADSRPSFIVTAVPSEFDSVNTVQVASLLSITEESLTDIHRRIAAISSVTSDFRTILNPSEER